jgi:hypothetical protein
MTALVNLRIGAGRGSNEPPAVLLPIYSCSYSYVLLQPAAARGWHLQEFGAGGNEPLLGALPPREALARLAMGSKVFSHPPV